MKRLVPFAIIEKLVVKVAGEGMDGKINVLEIGIDNCPAKEAMKAAIEYMDSAPVSVIEMVTADSLMQMNEHPELKEDIEKFDLVLAGDRMILEAAGVADRKYLQETEGCVFLKMFLRYLHKNHKRVYLLVESEEEGQRSYDYFQRHYGGIQVVGLAKVSSKNRADDMLVNAINGGEVDCILAALRAPLQQDFIAGNRNLLDARVWLGMGTEILLTRKKRLGEGKFAQFIMKFIFKKEMEKSKR